ncbi:MAG TPA: hypothetical protein V6D37_16230 [Candidatus Sericytochromatia bacterium]
MSPLPPDLHLIRLFYDTCSVRLLISFQKQSGVLLNSLTSTGSLGKHVNRIRHKGNMGKSDTKTNQSLHTPAWFPCNRLPTTQPTPPTATHYRSLN